MTQDIKNGIFQSLLNGHCAEFTLIAQETPRPADADLAASLQAFSSGEIANPENKPQDQVTTAPNQGLDRIRQGRNPSKTN